MSPYREVAFEDDICAHLADHGWHYDPDDAKLYDRTRALFPADLPAWVQTSQPQAWATLTKTHGSAAESVLLERVRKQMDARGTLDVLRRGVEILGLKRPLQLAQFKPALGMNAELQARYATNQLRVVRQVHYSLHNENSLDLVLFLNGLPVGTVGLKTDFTQSVDDAVDQYRFDWDPKTKGPVGRAAAVLLRRQVGNVAEQPAEDHMGALTRVGLAVEGVVGQRTCVLELRLQADYGVSYRDLGEAARQLRERESAGKPPSTERFRLRTCVHNQMLCGLCNQAECSYNLVMRFEWDEQKSEKNLAKHGLSFDAARLVFDDPRAVSIQDRHENGEERWQTIGLAGQTVILLVAHTCRDDEHGDEVIRIISARKATPKERKIYEQDDR